MFKASAYPRELVRATRLLLSSIDWVSEHEKFKPFDFVFSSHIEILSYLGETAEVDYLLSRYEQTVPHRDARYINYCYMRSLSSWVRGDFQSAIEWGKTGAHLVKVSDVDSKFSHNVIYTLALAERDAGHPASALPTFLEGRSLADVVDPEEFDQSRSEQHYGNVGRCLHLMGQIETALVCYQKSALIIERNPVTEHVLNQGYIRTWIGELLIGREELMLGYVFLLAAARRWRQVAPPKAALVSSLLRKVEGRLGRLVPIDDEAERICVEWILGHNVDIGLGEFTRSKEEMEHSN